MSTRPTLKQLADVFGRTGSFTFGGGSSTVVALEQDVVERRGWLSLSSFRTLYAVSRLTPGTTVLATCTALGWTLRGPVGSAVALLAASVPCSLLILVAMHFYGSWQRNPTFAIALQGASAAAVGIVAASAWRLLQPYLGLQNRGRSLLLVVGSFGLAQAGMPPVRVLLVAALVSLLWQERPPQ